jgi:hypothetical protein
MDGSSASVDQPPIIRPSDVTAVRISCFVGNRVDSVAFGKLVTTGSLVAILDDLDEVI